MHLARSYKYNTNNFPINTKLFVNNNINQRTSIVTSMKSYGCRQYRSLGTTRATANFPGLESTVPKIPENFEDFPKLSLFCMTHGPTLMADTVDRHFDCGHWWPTHIRPHRSTTRCGLLLPTELYMGCTLAPPEEYDWTVHVQRRCGLTSNYFEAQSLADAHNSMPCSNAAKMRNQLKFAGVREMVKLISAVSGPKFTILWGHVDDILMIYKFFPIVDTCLSCEDIARQRCAMVSRWRFLATFLRPVFSASRVQHISDLHSKFALKPRHVWKYGRHPISDRWD